MEENIATGLAHLRKADPGMAALISVVGPCLWKPKMKRSPFQSLVMAVANQQLNGKAAETILGRFCALFPGKKFPTPKLLAGVTDEQLRGVGFSWAKVAAIRDIAEKTFARVVPSSRVINSLSDEEIVERLVQVRGVGRWTVEMLLIFQLGRFDVWPVDDFGVRSGHRLIYGGEDLPKVKDLRDWGEKFRPHRTLAAWYLWRATEFAKEPEKLNAIRKAATTRSRTD